MPNCPQCGQKVPAPALSQAAKAGSIACPHCSASLEPRLRNRMLMNALAWCLAAAAYGVLVLLGVDRGLAFAIGLLVALTAGFVLLRFTRRKIEQLNH
jgi:uncharacterized paraquat-inducible protein A